MEALILIVAIGLVFWPFARDVFGPVAAMLDAPRERHAPPPEEQTEALVQDRLYGPEMRLSHVEAETRAPFSPPPRRPRPRRRGHGSQRMGSKRRTPA